MHLLWLRVAAVLYATACVAVFPATLYRLDRWRRACVHLGGMALFFHLVSVVEMLIQGHQWMPVGIREFESLFGFAVAGIFFLLWWFYEAISLGLFALPLTFFLVLVPALGPGGYTFPSSGVRIGWLLTHIVALMLAYVSLGFSMIASLFYLLQERRIKSKITARPGQDSWWTPLDWLPPLDTLERLAQTTLEFGFPCMTVGLALGCILVQETSLGASYFLDPKILAAFASWAVYVLLLLVRRGAGLRGRKAAYLTGSVFLIMVFVWIANFYSHVHRYGVR
jgi:ABC-type uncharacterized transport system permease subunit